MKKLVLTAVTLTVIAGIGVYSYIGNGSHLHPIDELVDNAHSYDGKRVNIAGTVSGNAGVFGAGGFFISDGKGEILVFTTSGIPSTGQLVEVRGKFHKALSLNTMEYSVVRAEKVTPQNSSWIDTILKF